MTYCTDYMALVKRVLYSVQFKSEKEPLLSPLTYKSLNQYIPTEEYIKKTSKFF